MERRHGLLVILCALLLGCCEGALPAKTGSRNAYATMMYMGTPRDYEFYVAIRVMLRSLAVYNTDADLVLIASKDVPRRWIRTLQEDGVVVKPVDNVANPYRNQPGFNTRFTLTLNKLYAWSLVEYKRVVMLDADNLFIQNTDELFQCGEFCAAFINPCIFHTGLFVLEPSMKTFLHLMNEVSNQRTNRDGADQGFLVSYFDDLLGSPMFHPPANGSKLDGRYRLPLGYQMDASYYYLRLKWHVPCGPNSVITFPGAPWLKPWYWWAWPVLPLGLSWHEQRVKTIGYNAEVPVMVAETLFYLLTLVLSYIACKGSQTSSSKLCMWKPEQTSLFNSVAPKVLILCSIIACYTVPFFLVPRTIHPIAGWGLYFLGAMSFATVIVSAFQLPVLPVFTPWIGILGSLMVMAFPFYSNGVVRALLVCAYAAFATPFLWWAICKIMSRYEAQCQLSKIC